MSAATEPGVIEAEPIEPDAMPNIGRPRARAVVSTFVTILFVVALATSLIIGLDGAHPVAAIVRALTLTGWAVAGLVVWRQGRMLAPVLLLGTAFGAAAALGAALLAQQPPPANPDLARTLEYLGGAVMVAVLLHAIVALPDGCLSSPLLRRIGAGIYLTCGTVGLVLLTQPPGRGRMLAEVAGVGVVGVVALSAVYTLTRYHQLAAADRRTGQWIAAGAACAGILAVFVVLGAYLLRWPTDAILGCLLATLPVPFAVASDATALSGRSDRALVRALTWLGAVMAASAITILVVVGLGHRPTGNERQLLALGLLAGVIVLATWEPVRHWVHTQASAFTYGDRPPPDAALSTLSTRLNRSVPLGDLLHDLAEVLEASQASAGAVIWTGQGRLLERSAASSAHPTPTEPPRTPSRLQVSTTAHDALLDGRARDEGWIATHLPEVLDPDSLQRARLLPVTHQQALLGLILVARPGNGDPFSESDERILHDITLQLGLALHNVRLDSTLTATLIELRNQANELRASRARLVSAANTERRRLERNLHDGAQQQLVGLAVKIGLARDLLERDQSAVPPVLVEMGHDVRGAIEELRNLARGIFPPLLADRGLGEAITSAARRSPLPVDVASSLARRFSPDLEAAVYFCCLEALQNAAKHAPDASVHITITADGETLTFTISDDGPGFDAPRVEHGDGFVNMTDRLGALGGGIEVASTPGAGTTVRGWVPVSEDPGQESPPTP